MAMLKMMGAAPASPINGRAANAPMIAASNAVCLCGAKLRRTKCRRWPNILGSIGIGSSPSLQLRFLARFSPDRARDVAAQSCQRSAMCRGQGLEASALHGLARGRPSRTGSAVGGVADYPHRLIECRFSSNRVEALNVDGDEV